MDSETLDTGSLFGGGSRDQAPKRPDAQRGRRMQGNDINAGDREAAGAIAGMLELYGAPRAEPVTEGIPLDVLVLDPSELEPE